LQETREVEARNLESLDLSSQKDREILLEEYEKESKRVKNITFKNLIWTFILFFLVLAVTLPKIYISNQIYYLSKEINTLYHQYTALKEEKAHLKRKLESIRYRVEVLDDLE
jgi:cell division protein FtsL